MILEQTAWFGVIVGFVAAVLSAASLYRMAKGVEKENGLRTSEE